MKTRNGFVSNSSSTAFIITNRTKEKKTLVDFVNENPHLVRDFCEEYDEKDEQYTQENMVASAMDKDMVFRAGEEKRCVFGDGDGTLIGRVFDYILRDGGESPSFAWRFEEMMR